MVRRAFHIRIADGKRDAYREAHKDVPDALERAYTEAGAGLGAYSIFECDGHVFGYLEVDNPDLLDESVGESEAMVEWGERMDDIIADVNELDEVYRMV